MAAGKRKDGWTLVWNDEFDGDRIDPSKWAFDIGNGFFDYQHHAWIPGWGNEELQYYTHEPENVVLRDSCLVPGPRSVRDIARELDVHPVHLARRFRRHFDTTPGDYLRRCRLDRARSLLRRSQASLADIASATGFTDQSHFTNAFRKTFGISPGAFRRS